MGTTIMKELKQLLTNLATYDDSEDGVLVTKAAQFAKRCHEGFRRLDGSPYILHPIAVATILSEWQAPPKILAAALLHDIFKRQYSHAPSLAALEAQVTPSLASLIHDVASLGGLGPALIQHPVEMSAEQAQETDIGSGERFSWAAVVLQRDPLAVVIKLADRLHNLQSHYALPEAERQEGEKWFAAALLNIFAPLADRMGMQLVKEMLEDGGFRIYNYERFASVEATSREVLANVPIDDHISNLEQILQEHSIEAKVLKRLRHRYAIFRHQLASPSREVTPADILSIFVVVKSVEDCYRTLGVVHSMWRPMSEVFDYIAIPKANGYRGLHTRVFEPSLGAFRVIIRTEAMHLAAEHGITAGWRGVNEELLPKIDPLPERPDGHIMAITPKGEVKYLPEGATPIDFAYAIHEEIGHRCMQAWVNGKQAPLEASLQDGAVVDIIISRGTAGPSRDWLHYVVTATAREAIEKWTRQQIDIELVVEGSDRVGLLKDVVDAISARGINILYVYAEVQAGGKACICIGLRQIGKVEIDHLERDIKELPRITHIRRQPLSEAIDQVHSRSMIWSSSGSNPYSLDPVSGGGFKGREREVQEIVDRLRGRDRDNTLLIWGQQRIGKTSLLYHLEKDVLPSKTYLIVYVTLHAVLNQPISYFLHRIAWEIQQKIQKEEVKIPHLQRMRRDPIPYFQRFIDHLEQVIGPQSLLIILDEFQGIGTLKEEGATRQDVFSNFRSTVQRGISINFLFCGGGIPKRLLAQSGLNSLLAIVDSIKIETLEKEAAQAVVTELDPSLLYDAQAVERLLEVTRYHPCYLKYLCKELYITRTRQKITLADIERVIEQTMEWGPKLEGLIKHFWVMDLQNAELADKNEKVLIAIAHGADSSGWTTFERIAEQTHPKITDRELPGLLANLTDYGSIDVDRLSYRIHIPLLELWLQRSAH